MKNNKKLKRISKKILLSLLLGSVVGLPILNVAYALPKGFSSTTATSITDAAKMDIMGSVNNNVINWKAFSIANGETVNFNGTNKNYLNLVNGVTKSNISGALNGVGNNIYLVNPNGVIFGKTARVNVSNLGVSTRDIALVDVEGFKNGNDPIKGSNVDSAIGDITNLGEIQAQNVSLEGRNIIIQDATHLINKKQNKLTGDAVFIRASGDVTVGHKIKDKVTLSLKVDSNNDGSYTTEEHEVSDYANVTNDDFASAYSYTLEGETCDKPEGQYYTGYDVKNFEADARNYTEAMLVKDIYNLQNIEKFNDSGDSTYDCVKGNYLLAGDIDASETAKWEENFTPIANSKEFKGSFNGANNAIIGLVVNEKSNSKGLNYVGLFGYVCDSKIENVRLEDCNITATSNGYVGSLAGYVKNSIVKNVASSGEINCIASGDFFVGGLVGRLNETTLSNSYNEATVNINKTARSQKEGTTYKHLCVGGITGSVYNDSKIKNTYNKGALNYTVNEKDDLDIGGISGYSMIGKTGKGSIIENTYNLASIEGEKTSSTVAKPSIGGIIGFFWANELSLKNNYYAIKDANGQYINEQATFDEACNGINILTYDGMLKYSTYRFNDDIDKIGGQHKTWRIYEGKTAPLLTDFLETIVVKADDVAYSGQNPEDFTEVLEGGPLDPNKLVAVSGIDVGSYIIYSDQKGYDLVTEAGTSTPILNIDPKKLTVTMNDAKMTYGYMNVDWKDRPNDSDGTYSTVKYDVSGFVGDEADNLVDLATNDETSTGKLTVNYSNGALKSDPNNNAVKTQNVGDYALTCDDTTENLKNYEIRSIVDGTVDISKASLELKAKYAGIVTYGDKDNTATNSSQYSYDTVGKGFVNGDSGSSLTNNIINYSNSAFDAGEIKDTINAGEDYHTSITLNKSLNNYDVSFVNSDAKVVAKKAITLVAANTGKTYDGKKGILNGQILTGTDTNVLVNSDSNGANISYALVNSDAKNVGKYDIKGTISGVPSLNTNYTISDTTVDAYTINPATLTINMHNFSTVYGDALGVWEKDAAYSVEGYVNGEADNLDITKKVSVSNVVNGAYENGSGGKTNDVNDKYAITATASIEAGNYELSSGLATPATAVVTPAKLRVKVNNAKMTYGDATVNWNDLQGQSTGVYNDSKNEFIVEGFVYGEEKKVAKLATDDKSSKGSLTVNYSNGALKSEPNNTAVKTQNVGDYALTYDDITENLKNYEIESGADGTVDISKASLAITPDEVAVTYGDVATTRGYSSQISGLTNGDTISSLLEGKIKYSNSAFEEGKTKDAGNDYSVSVQNSSKLTADLTNYNVDYNTSDGTISKKALNAIMNDATMIYGNSDLKWDEKLGNDSSGVYKTKGYSVDGFAYDEASDETLQSGVDITIENKALDPVLGDSRITNDVGSYAINGVLNLDETIMKNYEAGNVESGSVKVNRALLKVIADDITMETTATEIPKLTGHIEGIVNGDSIPSDFEFNVDLKEGESLDTVGNHSIIGSAGGVSEGAYKLNYYLEQDLGNLEAFKTIDPNAARIEDVIDGKDTEYNNIVNSLLAPDPNEIHNRRVVTDNVVSPTFYAFQTAETKTVQKIIDANGKAYIFNTYDGLLKN